MSLTPSAPSISADEDFYSRLLELTDFNQVVRQSGYVEAPESWVVVITDVQGSTRAIEQGRYRDVNALGVASIIAVTNSVRDIEVPYVFGGDGATLLVPERRLDVVESALRRVQQLAVQTFDLDVRIARVSVRTLQRDQHPVRVARFRASPHVVLAMFAGTGFSTAEKWIKDPARGASFAVPREGPADADFDGFECRWRPVSSRRGQVVSLLVVAMVPGEQRKEQTYSQVLFALERILDGRDAVPVSRQSLRVRGWFDDFSVEAKVRSLTDRGPGYDAAWRFARKKASIGRALMAVGASAGGFDGSRYRDELIQNTDFRKFDDTLRMVLDLTKQEADALESWLAEQHEAGLLAYGLHRATAALVTCMVRSHTGNHLHFVDGAEGGYALAARQLKAQLRRFS